MGKQKKDKWTDRNRNHTYMNGTEGKSFSGCQAALRKTHEYVRFGIIWVLKVHLAKGHYLSLTCGLFSFKP